VIALSSDDEVTLGGNRRTNARELMDDKSLRLWLAGALALATGCNEIKKELAKELVKKAGIKRDVPRHDLSVVADCPAESMRKIDEAIGAAIEVGAPTYNRGDHRGCFEVYEHMTREIDRTVPRCTKIRAALMKGIEIAATRDDFTGKAWAMRDAFDGALEVIDRKLSTLSSKTEGSREGAPSFVPRRDVPHHEAALLDGCSNEALAETERGIARAIQVGAPLYNQKNAEACFRIYQSVALDLKSSLERCDGPKRALAAGLARAKEEKTFEAKAWAMRDAFDAILEVIDRTAAR
jgi:hypothetical protein